MPELEHEVRRVMESVLLGLLGDEPDEPSVVTKSPALTCSVGISGEWNGQVIVQASYDLARAAAARMFGAANAQVVNASDAQDAVREIANIVAGNIKPLLGDLNALGFPEDLAGELSFPAAGQRARAAVVRNDGRLEVRVFEM